MVAIRIRAFGYIRKAVSGPFTLHELKLLKFIRFQELFQFPNWNISFATFISAFYRELCRINFVFHKLLNAFYVIKVITLIPPEDFSFLAILHHFHANWAFFESGHSGTGWPRRVLGVFNLYDKFTCFKDPRKVFLTDLLLAPPILVNFDYHSINFLLWELLISCANYFFALLSGNLVILVFNCVEKFLELFKIILNLNV